MASSLDTTQSLEHQEKETFTLRSIYRTKARELMADREMAAYLNATEVNKTWEEIVQKQIDRGLTGDDIYRAIIESSQKSRSSVNKQFNLE